MSVYGASQRIMRIFARVALANFDVRGLPNVPEKGAFLLVANHQSILDPLLIQAVCPRVLHTMAKSTQFTHPAMAWYMRKANAFPVRRYRIDPQAVRIALRRLDAGLGVGVYIEGERSWDGRLQKPRLGTLRLILKAGVAVVPCGIRGAYDVWPRWDSWIRRASVQITFGDPIRFPTLDDRAQRERRLDSTARTLMGRLAALTGEDDPPAVGAARTPVRSHHGRSHG